ncbi:UNVERIFIED_CONTAM: hypothetical protein FKN15_029087 [Acipenser sinensis]
MPPTSQANRPLSTLAPWTAPVQTDPAPSVKGTEPTVSPAPPGFLSGVFTVNQQNRLLTRGSWIQSQVVVWRRSGPGRSVEEEWSGQQSGGEVVRAAVWRHGQGNSVEEEWSGQQCGGVVRAAVWRSGQGSSVEEEWSGQQCGRGVVRGAVWRSGQGSSVEEEWSGQQCGGGVVRAAVWISLLKYS